MLEALGEWMGYPCTTPGRARRRRRARAHRTPASTLWSLRAGDGGAVMLEPAERARMEAFCEQVLLQPAHGQRCAPFDSNAQRNANREELRALVLDVCSAR